MINNRPTISFADLIHLGHTNMNAVPLGISLVASRVLNEFKHKIKVDLFKFSDDFNEYLKHTIPNVACFSSYIWNFNLNYEFARQIKKRSPGTVIVFGGPKYPLESQSQEAFLLSHPEIDFYIFREGEQPFAELFSKLMEYEFNISKIKTARLNIPSCHYISNGNIIRGDPSLPLNKIDDIPSPYLLGLCDKFLKMNLVPLVLTTRGCPFTCTFCQNGNEYFSRIRRYSFNRVKEELHYIVKRTTNPNLMLADSNFGMYKDDLRLCKEIVSIRKKYMWPKYFLGLSGKNNKARVLKAASIIQESSVGVNSAIFAAAVQSTDKKVLENIKRQNVSSEVYLAIAKKADSQGLNTFGEIILCLPGDTKDTHFKSVFELIDSGINTVRSHQLIMLDGAELSTRKSRQKYSMLTRFRVMPKTAKPYQIFGETFITPEIDEICVSNSTMSFDDYLECRVFNLTVEVFYNDGIFRELLNFLELYHISRADFIMTIHNKLYFKNNPLSDLYNNFLQETKELWESKDSLEDFLQQPGIISRYVAEELGNNEQLKYRALMILKHMEDLNRIAFDTAKELLEQNMHFNQQIQGYLDELAEYCLLCKKDIFLEKENTVKIFHYDFTKLEKRNFKDNPRDYYKPEGICIEFKHTNEQKELINNYVKLYGLSDYGVGNILSNASHVSALYRKAQIHKEMCRNSKQRGNK